MLFRFQVPGCKTVALPAVPSNKVLKKNLKEKIKSGEYKIGRKIVPQEFQKSVIKNNKITTEVVKISGRKITLQDIRSDFFKKHEKFMRLTDDNTFNNMNFEEIKEKLIQIYEYQNEPPADLETLRSRLKYYERKRNFMMWHDGSTISSHGYLLMMVACLYDPAIFLTDPEVKAKLGIKINVQAVIEKPEIYILARCPSNDNQILYSHERFEDILSLKKPLQELNKPEISDVMRFFKGDKPASQFEAGQQKGGNYFCFLCGIHADTVASYIRSNRLKSQTLCERMELINETDLSKTKIQRGCLKLYDNLKKHEIIEELQCRQIKFYESKPAKDLQNILDDTVHGIQRFPTILYGNESVSLADINLQDYEILFTEPLHDISNHIKNLYAEIPYHVDKKIKKDVTAIIDLSFNNKDARNSADYRRSLLFVTKWFQDNLTQHFITKLLMTFSEIQEIMYLEDSKRTPITILRLYTTIFHHALTTKINLRNTLKKITPRKFFGSYYHSIISHSALQYRIISGRASNTEKEESTFNTLKTLAKLTSNHHDDNIILNSLIRLQAKDKLASSHEKSGKSQSSFTDLYFPLKALQQNTVIPFTYIKKYHQDYQVLLENISDYLIEGCGSWWSETETGVEFYDKSNNNVKKKLHHFRSSNLRAEERAIQKCWEECLENKNKLIPAFKIKVNGAEEILNTLTFFTATTSETFLDNVEEGIENKENQCQATQVDNENALNQTPMQNVTTDELINVSPIQQFEKLSNEHVESPMDIEINMKEENHQHELQNNNKNILNQTPLRNSSTADWFM